MVLNWNPATVVVQLESFEKRGQLADGVEYEFWTFGDSVPGPLVRVREGDAVELHFENNAASKFRRIKGYRELPILIEKLAGIADHFSQQSGKVA